MADNDLDSGLQLPLVPVLAFLRWHGRAQHDNPETGLAQNRLQAQSDVLLSGVGGIDLATPALAQLLTYVGNERTLFGKEPVRGEIYRRGSEKPYIFASLRIKGPRPDRIEPIGMIRVEQQRVKQNAHQTFVAAVLAHRRAKVVLPLQIGG